MSTSTINFKQLLFLAIFGLFCIKGNTQENFSILVEPEFSINIETQSRWSYNFGIGNRNLLFANEEGVFEAQHLELNHLTGYKIGSYSKVGLGVRYRFEEIFDESVTNEKRLIQQYGYSRKYNTLEVAHRIRLEERFRENTTFRTRYEFSVETPLNESRADSKDFFLVAETEALWSLGKFEKPSFEQRVGLSLEHEIGENTEAALGLEYRYDDYTRNPESELFIQTGLSIDL